MRFQVNFISKFCCQVNYYHKNITMSHIQCVGEESLTIDLKNELGTSLILAMVLRISDHPNSNPLVMDEVVISILDLFAFLTLSHFLYMAYFLGE